MKLLYICGFQFKKIDGFVYSFASHGNSFWAKYLNVFDSIQVLGIDILKKYDNGKVEKITDSRINIHIMPNNPYPLDFVKDHKIKKTLKAYIKESDAIIIKPSTRRGIMAIKICKKIHKPYMIEVTGDIYSALKNKKSIVKRFYAPIIYRQTLKAISDCEFGLYVTQDYLEKLYPIQGKQCGCTDSIISDPDIDDLNKRIEKIEYCQEDKVFKIGLVGTYHGNGKGLDTAIEALSICDKKCELHILGVGVKKDRDYWYSFASKKNFQNLFFDEPKTCVQDVLDWNKTMDLIILPSRSEGLPRCIVESMSVGCPCIVSNVCGLPELINKEWLHNPGDFKTLSILIERAFSSKETLIEMARDNFMKSKQYTFDVLTKKRDAFLLEFKEYCIARK